MQHLQIGYYLVDRKLHLPSARVTAAALRRIRPRDILREACLLRPERDWRAACAYDGRTGHPGTPHDTLEARS